MAPYIVTTLERVPTGVKSPEGTAETTQELLSRVAVETLDEARTCRKGDVLGAADLIVESALRRGSTEGYPADPLAFANRWITEAGGTVPRLPDGTVIEVKPTTWEDLGDELARVIGPQRHALVREAEQGDPQRLLAAFNAAQGVS